MFLEKTIFHFWEIFRRCSLKFHENLSVAVSITLFILCLYLNFSDIIEVKQKCIGLK